ncbi:hypothetical protein SAMN02745146_0356 [Hymenobacter daecheongensis DSM 21074]|uniref:Uncharacterized protein n=1 Tax=Hymenobacter daecheongensis DSM 21074 TaxID=1121955 RepID=A0A1M6MPY0_9BACT|nr:hypothetical protein [Hymenobacter daecheongensis]SHJ85420.1 hypothetical protein SAMN02745146_0356 [Hymenobacter daecheongensis DSM 21074]
MTSLHFLLRLVLGALNLVLAYLVQPLPKWQVQLVRVAAVVSTSAAVVMLAQGASIGQSLAPFFLLLVASRPLPARGRWKFGVVMACLFLVVGGIPLTWLQAHGLL